MRAFAALCWHRTLSPAAAAAEFRRAYPEAVRHPGKFCKKWGQRFAATGSVADAPGRGRPPAVPLAVARRAAALMRRGPGTGNPADNYTSISDAVDRCSELAAILEECGCTPGTLMRAMRAADPNLVQRAQRFRPPLSQKNRKLRLALARRNLRLVHDVPTYWRRVVWVDAKKLWLRPASGLVWTDRRNPPPVHTHRHLNSGGRPICLHYYAAVNADLGPIAIVFVTGTTGLNCTYKVGGWCGRAVVGRRRRRRCCCC